jgi:glutamate--cysteine ligase catalytic subunit
MRQFLSTFRRVKDLKGDELLWGDEIEYGIFHLDPETKKVRLSLRAKQVSIALYSQRLICFECDGSTFVASYPNLFCIDYGRTQ